MKYKQNLRVDGDKVYSYNTHVATIQDGRLLVHGWWSMTTSKHINHVANEYGLTKIDAPPPSDNKESSVLQFTGVVAALGDIFCDEQKDRNDWKVRMLKAGLSGLSIPDNWDALSEDEKQLRLNRVIEVSQEERG